MQAPHAQAISLGQVLPTLALSLATLAIPKQRHHLQHATVVFGRQTTGSAPPTTATTHPHLPSPLAEPLATAATPVLLYPPPNAITFATPDTPERHHSPAPLALGRSLAHAVPTLVLAIPLCQTVETAIVSLDQLQHTHAHPAVIPATLLLD